MADGNKMAFFAQLLVVIAAVSTLHRPLASAMVIPESNEIDIGDRCRRSSPQLNECVKEGLTKAIRKLKNGSLEFGMPSLDPMEVPYLEVHSDESNLTVDLIMKNVQIRGLSDIAIAKVTTLLGDVNKLEVTGKTPALHLSGEYTSEGLIVNFPLHSQGSFDVNMTEVTSSWVIYLREFSHGGASYLQVDGFDMDMMPINISFRPAEQLDGDNHLGEAVNLILNENSSEMYSIIKGRLSGVLSGMMTELANVVLNQVPERDYLIQ